MKRLALICLLSFIAWSACSALVEKPIADAGANQSPPAAGALIQLDGSASSDPGNQPLIYAWRFLELPWGSHATLNNPATVKPSFVADVGGTYRLSLLVSNGTTVSDPAFVTVDVGHCGNNVPVIDSLMAAPAMPSVGALVTFNATVSHADELPPCSGKRLRSYAWNVSKRPSGSSAPLLQPGTAAPSITADVAGAYEVSLVVTDDLGHVSQPKSLAFTVGVCGGQAPTKADITASSDAPAIGQTVQLDAQVTDPDTAMGCGKTETFSYAWSLVALPLGSQASLNLPQARNPSILIDAAGDYTFHLVATDAAGHPSPVAVKTITATSCGGNPPVVGTITASAASIGKPVVLSATVTDADNSAPCSSTNQNISYQWTIISLPVGSTASVNLASLQSPSFVPDVAGDYVVSLVATDADGHASAAKTLTVTVSSCGGNVPVIGAITTNPLSFAANQAVTLSAVVTDGDQAPVCNITENFSYAWSITASPKGSLATLAQPQSAQPTFVGDVAGSYTIALVVTDAQNHVSATSYLTLATTACGSSPPTALIGELVPNVIAGGAAVIGPIVNIGATVQLNAASAGSASFDADNVAPCAGTQTLSYSWKFLALPTGSKSVFNNPTVVNPSFTADVCGNYVIGLTITDSTNLKSATATFTMGSAVALKLPPGFGASVLACAGDGIGSPRGVAVNPAAGEIFIANEFPPAELKFKNSQVTILATNFNGANEVPRMIAYYPANNETFVSTVGNINLFRVSAAGVKSACNPTGDHYHSLKIHTTASNTLRLVAAVGNANEQVQFINPTNCTVDKSNLMGGAIPQDLGVAAIVRNDAVLGLVDDTFLVINGGTNDIRRNETPVAVGTPQGVLSANNVGVNANIATNRLPNLVHITCEGDLAATPCPNKKVLASDGTTLRLFDNSTAAPAANGVDIVTGFPAPCDSNGIAFEDANNLLVTSLTSNGLIRITGDFCSL